MKPESRVRKLLRKAGLHLVKWDKMLYVFSYRYSSHSKANLIPTDFPVGSLQRKVTAEIVEIMTVNDIMSVGLEASAQFK